MALLHNVCRMAYGHSGALGEAGHASCHRRHMPVLTEERFHSWSQLAPHRHETERCGLGQAGPIVEQYRSRSVARVACLGARAGKITASHLRCP